MEMEFKKKKLILLVMALILLTCFVTYSYFVTGGIYNKYNVYGIIIDEEVDYFIAGNIVKVGNNCFRVIGEMEDGIRLAYYGGYNGSCYENIISGNYENEYENSLVYKQVNDWYYNNMYISSNTDIVVDSGYCNLENSLYNCESKNNLYTVGSKGNGKLIYPVSIVSKYEKEIIDDYFKGDILDLESRGNGRVIPVITIKKNVEVIRGNGSIDYPIIFK